MNVSEILFHLGEQPVTAGRLGVAVVLLLGFVAVAIVANSYFSRRLLWPGSAGGDTVRLVLAIFLAEIIFVGLLSALAVLGVNVIPFAAIVLAAGAIWALAWRTTSEQVWAGLLILWERPFSLGERIMVGDYEGEVERVGLRTTTLRTEERMALHVPNSYLTTHAIHNRSKTEGGFGLRIPVVVMPHCESGDVISALRKAAERNNRVRSSPSPKAFMTGFVPRGLKFELRAWVDAYTDAAWAENELCRAIQSEFQRAGIQLASTRPPSRHSGVDSRPKPRPRFDEGDRDRGPDRERDRDRDRDSDRAGREARPERARGERPVRPDRSARPERPERQARSDRHSSGSEGGSSGRHRTPRQTAEPSLNLHFEEPAPMETQAYPQVDQAEEAAPVMPPQTSHAYNAIAVRPLKEPPARVETPEPPEPPAAFEPPAPPDPPEPIAYSPPEPEPAPEPLELTAPEEPSPAFGRSKRRVPRR